MVDTYFIALTGVQELVAGVSLVVPVFTLMIAFGDIFGPVSYTHLDGCVCINVKIKDAQENQNYKKVYEFIQKQNNENSLSFIHFMHNIVMFFTKTDVSKCIDYANDLHNKLNNM